MRNSDLPAKTCTVCGRLMVWRKRRTENREAVKYCPERCRRGR